MTDLSTRGGVGAAFTGWTVRRATRSAYVGGAIFVVGIAVLAYLPYLMPRGTINNLTTLLSLIVLGTMWNLLAGYGGMVSIGQQAYIGVGAYGTVHLADIIGLSPFVAVVLAGLICGLVALPTSLLVFRLVGGYFAIGTWVVAEVFKLVMTQVETLGAGSGISLSAFGGTEPVWRIATVYWFSLALTVAAIVGTYLLLRSRLGLGLTAIRDDPTAAASMGVRVDRAKRLVYLASAVGCGFAGGMITLNTLRVQPDAVFSVNYTAFMIFIVIIGGIGSIEGPILGAIVFFVLRDMLSPLGSWYLVVLGVVAIAVTLLAPKGLWHLLTRGRIQLFPVGHVLLRPRE